MEQTLMICLPALLRQQNPIDFPVAGLVKNPAQRPIKYPVDNPVTL